MSKPSREDIAELLKERYKLNSIQVTNVLEYAYGLSEARSKPNDFATALMLNNLAMGFFEMIANNNRNLPDTTDINRSYVLITNQLKKLYERNPELKEIEDHICWKAFEAIDYIDGQELWEYGNDGDYGQRHNSKVNKLCIINGKEKPELSPELKAIVREAEANGKAFYAELEDKDEPVANDGRFIPEYRLTYDNNGTILVNGVLQLKKAHAGRVPDMLMSQSFQHDGQKEPFQPDLATKRQLTTIIGDLGFDKTLRAIFFPTISKAKGIVFRSRLSRDAADALHIDTRQLDKKLKKLGAETEQEPEAPIDLSDIPF